MTGIIFRVDDGDLVIDRSTVILTTTTGYEAVTETSGSEKIANVGKNETLIINGHGNATTLGRFSATELAAYLALKGLTSPVKIELIACETGFGRSPFALELKTQLSQGHKIMASVSAPTRYVAVLAGGQTAVVDATFTATGAVASVTPVTAGTSTVSSPWGPRKVNTATQYKTT
jgi:hypothetical protein